MSEAARFFEAIDRCRRSAGFFAASGAFAAALIGLWPLRVAALPPLVAVTPLEGIEAHFGVALSADGTTVVGSRLRQDNPAFLWTRDGGYRSLDELGPKFLPQGLSGDGSRIVGSLDGQPVVWDRGGATTLLALPTGGTSGGDAMGISDDGRYVVGRAHDGGVVQDVVMLPGGGLQIIERPREVPVRWNLDDSAVVVLSESSGDALDVSNDGVAVGNLDLPFIPNAQAGFRWGPGEGLQFLPTANPGVQGWSFSARAISTDGRTIVGLTPGPPLPGSMDSFGPPRAYAWEGEAWAGEPGAGEALDADGLILLDQPAFGSGFEYGATAVSADGSTIVGTYYRDGDASFVPRPFLWTDSGGFQDLEVLLNTIGVPTEGWTLNGALDVSADGKTIIGTGRRRNEVGRLSDAVWIAVIPEPSTALLLGAGLSMLAIRPRERSAERHRARGA